MYKYKVLNVPSYISLEDFLNRELGDWELVQVVPKINHGLVASLSYDVVVRMSLEDFNKSG